MTFRIQRSAERELVVFTLTGRIQLEQVAELQTIFNSETARNRVVLDLKEVKLVDRDTVRFLEHCETKGVKLENCPAYIREWIKQERNAK